MADKDENSLIGFDPLAWMEEETVLTENDSSVTEQRSSSVESQGEAGEDISTDDIVEQSEVTGSEAIQPEQASEKNTLVLESSQNIQNVSVLHDKLVQMLDQFEVIEIDASSVSTIDTATLQLLIVLKQSAVKVQKQVVIDFPSDRFIDAAELLGLSEMLGVEKAEAGFF